MTQSLLRFPRLKIDRAKHHINDLNGKINAYLAQRPYTLVVIDDPEAEKRTVRIKTNIAIPDELSMILGDAIHNLRSALDLVVFGMVGNKAPRPEAVQFPFASRVEALEATIKNRQVEFAGEKVVNAIKALKPYPGGDALLYGIHALDIADKHKLIVAVGRVTQMPADLMNQFGLGATFVGDGVFHFAAGLTDLISIGLEFESPEHRRAFRLTETEAKIQPTFQICFPEGELFANQSVIVKLHEMVARVTEVADSLAYTFTH